MHSSQNILINSTSSYSVVNASNSNSSQDNLKFRGVYTNQAVEVEQNYFKPLNGSLVGTGALWIAKNRENEENIMIQSSRPNDDIHTEQGVSKNGQNNLYGGPPASTVC